MDITKTAAALIAATEQQLRTDEAVLGMQPTSSASSAEIFTDDELAAAWSDRFPFDNNSKHNALIFAREMLAKSTVPQVVQAPIEGESLSWPDEVAHLLKMQVAAPIVATVPSEQRQIAATMANVMFNLAQKCGDTLTSDDCAMFDALRKQWDAAPSPTEQASSPIFELWDAAKAEAAMYVEHHCVDGEMHADAILKQPRPAIKDAEQASDVRNASDTNSWPMRPWPNLEMRSTAYASAFKYSPGDATRRQSFMAGAQWMSQFVEALEESNKQTVKAAQAEILALKSATPADKGNAPAEAKGNQS